MGRRGEGEDRRPPRPGVRPRLPLPGRPERRPHDRRRRRDVQDPPDPDRDHRGEAERDRSGLRRRPGRPDGRARRARVPRAPDVRPALALRQRAPRDALARRARRRARAAARPAPDRDHATRHRPRVRGQGDAHRHPRPGPARRQDPAPEAGARGRREERLARARVRARAVRRRGDRGELPRARRAARPVRGGHLTPRRSRAQGGREGAVRGSAGHAARPRPRDVPLRHVVEPDRRGRRRQLRHRPEPHRRGRRRREGLRDAGGRRPVPERDRGACERARARARKRVRDRDGAGAEMWMARPRRAAVRGARQRDHEARADEARRPLGVRGAARLRPVRAAGRIGDLGVPGAPERLPPLPAGLRDARRLAGAGGRRPSPGGARLRRASSRTRSTSR